MPNTIPCPFCGCERTIIGQFTGAVHCGGCKAMVDAGSVDKSVENWNTRNPHKYLMVRLWHIANSLGVAENISDEELWAYKELRKILEGK